MPRREYDSPVPGGVTEAEGTFSLRYGSSRRTRHRTDFFFEEAVEVSCAGSYASSPEPLAWKGVYWNKHASKRLVAPKKKESGTVNGRSVDLRIE